MLSHISIINEGKRNIAFPRISNMKKAIFIDKDGTIIKDVPYNIDLKKIKFLPGVLQGLKTLQSLGYEIIIVSNQAGIAKGFFAEDAFRKVAGYLKKLFKKFGEDALLKKMI